MTSPRFLQRARRRAAQRGVSLLFAMLTLAALMLTALALVRSVDTNTLLLGNIGFKQDATAAADQATRQAIAWLTTHSASLNTNASSGYYASTLELASDGVTVKPPVDVTGRQQASLNRQLIDWDNNNCRYATSGTYTSCELKSASLSDINGNQASYVIFRLCSKPGAFPADTTISCATPLASSGGVTTSKEACDYGRCPITATSVQPYYRVVVRVLGARNTASFTETIVHF
ncbi:pilus assembly protein PilX [Variovorax rhizosphaerae]|uniref:Pilus assembly protein PilX n=1 Tax=Variovorax rhizosphaerae TaxID=1836200 RepID=A0ABU8WCH3_9BURK